MYYFNYQSTTSSAYDTAPLQVVGFIKVYMDEAKTQYLTQIPFPTFLFEEVPVKTIEGFNTYVESKVAEVTGSQEWQSKLDELKLAYDLGIYIPQE